MNSINVFGLQMAVEELYYNNYQNLLKTEKKYYGENVLEPENRYTFAEDMVIRLINDNPKQEIGLYIERMLNTFCKGRVQAYYEMLLSVSIVALVFYESKMFDLSKYCAQWFATLAYDEDFYSQYVTEGDIERFWTLR